MLVFESTTAVSYDYSKWAYWYVNQSACDDSCWWERVPVYKQTYTDYQKYYTYKIDLESSTAISASDTISNVKKWVKYQAK